MVTIDPNVTDVTLPHNRMGRVTFEIKVPEKNFMFDYKLSLVYVNLFDPEDETNLNNPDGKAEGIPFNRETVTFDINLGQGLLEKIEKSKAKKLELQFKIQLHLERIYAMRDGSSYCIIECCN